MDRKNVFLTALSAEPLVNVPLPRIKLAPDARPVRVRLRNYSQDQHDLLSKTVKRLVECGMNYPNPTSLWGRAPLQGCKSGFARFRFTTDLSPVNSYTTRYQYPMPDIEHELSKTSESKHCGKVDFSHGFWQFPLHPGSQASQFFILPGGIYSPTRVLHGTTSAVIFLQSTLSNILSADLRHYLLWWLDDIFIHTKTIDYHFLVVQKLSDFCIYYNLRLHPAKYVLFNTSIRWCGRILAAGGISSDPRRIEGI